MGTVVTIDVYAAAGAQVAGLGGQLDRARAVLHHADEVFSTWRPHSPVSRLRSGEITAEQAPAEVAEVLKRCAIARGLSGGWFDPWAMPGGIDPTGLVKGWAAQNALAAFCAPGIAGVIVNAAGDIASFGGLGNGEPFRFGIADPRAPRRLAEVVELTGAIATSGSYERGGHLFDPRTGRPAMRAASASVTGPDLGLADALATALAVAGTPGLALIEPLDGYEALIIGFDGTRQWTERFPFASRAAAQPHLRHAPRHARRPRGRGEHGGDLAGRNLAGHRRR
jgi:thiamine biosynthesis lipoprotein